MANFVVLGAGVMGSALATVATENNKVTLVGSPLDSDIIDCLKQAKSHPVMQVTLPRNIVPIDCDELDNATMKDADVIVIGVSSPGVDWALSTIRRHEVSPKILALVTKGLVSKANNQSAPVTYAQTIDAELTTPANRIVGIGGPCIARELALGYPTRVCFASHNIDAANQLKDLLQTDYYHIATNEDFTGLEACAALKNFMCIGVSAMFTSHPLEDSFAKNPVAALFNQAVHEIALLSRWIKSGVFTDEKNPINHSPHKQDIAFDLAGLGDLHVTVGGGRNSKLGQFLGTGRSLKDILETDMLNITVEGIGTAEQLLPGFRAACNEGSLTESEFPLTCAILNVVENDRPFAFKFHSLPN